ncbi:MAG: diguanylate cyclase [Actinobacteria bacterium]|nr:diguanylate cyclase [Actinomycetota bacterium]
MPQLPPGTGLLAITFAALVASVVLAGSPACSRRRRLRILPVLGAAVLWIVALLHVFAPAWLPLRIRGMDEILALCAALATAACVLAVRPWEKTAVSVRNHLFSALEDPLTGTASHRAFQDRLSHECERAYRFGDSFTLLILDIDQFRLINNRYGHLIGDRVLAELAGRLKTWVRGIDLCARFGGDQFAIILPHTLRRGSMDSAERIRQNVAAWSFQLPKLGDVRLTVSVGIATYPDDGRTAPELVDAAKYAVLFAKTLGGNQVQTYRELPHRGDLASATATGSPSHSTIVRSLAAAVDIRDRYTHSHSRLVSALSQAVARQMGLAISVVNQVTIGALLHDVGKIGVPDAILTKEGSLTQEEWESIKQHPALGKTIIEQAPELRNVVPLVLHHQERYDGTGYPGKLKGDAIPLGARIIAAADAYHAIRSDRPYRSGRTHEETVPELKRCAGTQFDPAVVEALLQALEGDAQLRSLVNMGDCDSVVPFPMNGKVSSLMQ